MKISSDSSGEYGSHTLSSVLKPSSPTASVALALAKWSSRLKDLKAAISSRSSSVISLTLLQHHFTSSSKVQNYSKGKTCTYTKSKVQCVLSNQSAVVSGRCRMRYTLLAWTSFGRPSTYCQCSNALSLVKIGLICSANTRIKPLQQCSSVNILHHRDIDFCSLHQRLAVDQMKKLVKSYGFFEKRHTRKILG